MNFVRLMQREIDVDLEKRILRRCVVATRSLAGDGYIISPEGIDFAQYRENPVVLAQHGKVVLDSPATIGRCLAIEVSRDGFVTETQFADTRLARDYAYLYGVNATKEVFCRAWSINVKVQESEQISFDQAQAIAGELWDEALANSLRQEMPAVHVARKSRLEEYSAVALGEDRKALTRAAEAGIEVAGKMIFDMDLGAMQACVAELKRNEAAYSARLAKLEQEIQALRSEGASAAARSDSEAVLNALRSLRDLSRRQN